MRPPPIIPVALCVVMAGVAVAAPMPRVPPQQQEREQWVARCQTEMLTVKAGMTRSDLEKVFVAEGGFYQINKQTYVYRGCSYFKVRVVFKLAGSGLEMPANPKDRIVSISEPYINMVSQPN